MLNDLKFALYAIRKNFQNSVELRTSFLMNVVGMALNDVVFIIIWVCYIRTIGGINGWQQADVIGLLGFSTISFGFMLTFFNGLSKMPTAVSYGGFDRFLLSPKNLFLRVATSTLGISAIGDILFGIVYLIIYAFIIHAQASAILLIFVGIIAASLATTAALLMAASVSFWMMDGTTVSKGLFEMFLTPSLYPGGAFSGWTRFIFTFIIPSLVVGALPIEALKAVSWPQMLGWGFLSATFLFLALKLFYHGARRYESTSLGGFGS